MSLFGDILGKVIGVANTPLGQQVIGNALGVKPQTTSTTSPGAVPVSSNANGMPQPKPTDDTGDFSIVKMGDGGTFFFYAALVILAWLFFGKGKA